MVIAPAGPVNSNIPAKPANAPEIEKHNKIIYSVFNPANWAARGASPKSLIWKPNL